MTVDLNDISRKTRDMKAPLIKKSLCRHPESPSHDFSGFPQKISTDRFLETDASRIRSGRYAGMHGSVDRKLFEKRTDPFVKQRIEKTGRSSRAGRQEETETKIVAVKDRSSPRRSYSHFRSDILPFFRKILTIGPSDSHARSGKTIHPQQARPSGTHFLQQDPINIHLVGRTS